MPRVLRKAEVKRATKKRAAKKKATKKTVRTATILVNDSPLANQKLYGYSTHASYVKRQQRAYRVLDEIKQREISSVSNILKRLAGVKSVTFFLILDVNVFHHYSERSALAKFVFAPPE